MAIGDMDKVVTLANPGPPVPDGEGGYTESWTVVGEARMPAAIEPATVQMMERLGQDMVTSSATHLVTIRYVSGVTTKTRVTFHDGLEGDRLLSVTGRRDEQERHRFLRLFCTEAVS